MTNLLLQCIGALVMWTSYRSCAETAGPLAALAPEYAKIVQERPQFGVYALINNVACERCGMKARNLQKASSCLPKNVDAKKPVCMHEEEYLLEYGDKAMDLLECYVNYLEVKLEQLYCLLKANEVDKNPGLSTAPTTSKPASTLFVQTATLMLTTTSQSPDYHNESESVVKRNNSKSTTAEFRQKDPWLEVVDQLLPFGDVLFETRPGKATMSNTKMKRWNRKREEPHAANVPREEGRVRAEPTRGEVNSKQKDKNRHRDREVRRYGHTESAGYGNAVRGGRGRRRQRIRVRTRYPGVRKRHSDLEQRRTPSRLRGQGARDRRKPAQDFALADYDNRLTQSANERRVYNPWERYDRDRGEGVGYVRDRHTRASKASDKSRYSRRRGVRDRQQIMSASESAAGFRTLYRSRSLSRLKGRVDVVLEDA